MARMKGAQGSPCRRWWCGAYEGCTGLSMPQVGAWGSIFANISSEKGIFGQFEKHQKKGLKRFLTGIEKKAFACKRD